jgi:hypothetical protein
MRQFHGPEADYRHLCAVRGEQGGFGGLHFSTPQWETGADIIAADELL